MDLLLFFSPITIYHVIIVARNYKKYRGLKLFRNLIQSKSSKIQFPHLGVFMMQLFGKLATVH